MDDKFHAFYVFTAVRRFMFFLDPKRRSRIPIATLAASDISFELHEMADVAAGSDRAARSSWFLPAWIPNLQPDFNVSVFDGFDARLSAVLRELDESHPKISRSDVDVTELESSEVWLG